MTQWYYTQHGQRTGPVSEEQLHVLVRAGVVGNVDLVWRDGMADWEPVTAVFPGVVPVGPSGQVGYFNPLVHRGTDYAPIWPRILAGLIDFTVLRIPYTLVDVGLGFAGNTGRIDPWLAVAFAAATAVLMLWLYESLMVWRYQATLGKMACGLKVARADAGPITFALATGRCFAKILSGLLACGGFVVAAFTAKKQGLHDLMCKTVVLKPK